MSEEIIDKTEKTDSGIPSKEAKTRALIAHITVIGLIIAYVQNQENKSEYVSFYIRQMAGIVVISFATSFVSWVPFIGWMIGTVVSVLLVVLWVMSIISANNGEKKPLPIIGDKFQEWFKSI